MRFKSLVSGVLLCVASFAVSGCATVLHGTNMPVHFNSDPDGAVIEILNGSKCTTPCQYGMKRGNDSSVTFTKDGYKPVMIYIQSRTSGSVAGNIIAGGIIGGVIDGSNGASNFLYPNPVYIRMVPIDSDGEAMLLDKNGAVISTVAAYNAKVAADVHKGLQSQGLEAKDAK